MPFRTFSENAVVCADFALRLQEIDQVEPDGKINHELANVRAGFTFVIDRLTELGLEDKTLVELAKEIPSSLFTCITGCITKEREFWDLLQRQQKKKPYMKTRSAKHRFLLSRE